jgi:hypothetical protein
MDWNLQLLELFGNRISLETNDGRMEKGPVKMEDKRVYESFGPSHGLRADKAK